MKWSSDWRKQTPAQRRVWAVADTATIVLLYFAMTGSSLPTFLRVAAALAFFSLVVHGLYVAFQINKEQPRRQ